jgi:type I restriction enzyme S subunit
MPEGKPSNRTLRQFRPYLEYKDSGVEWFGKIPTQWELAPVYARYEVALGKMLDAKRVTGEFSGHYLRNVDVQWDAVNTEGLPEMDFAPSERERYLLRPGDLLVCEGGEVGRTAIWHGEIEECFYQKAIHRVRPRLEDEAPRFFFYLMRTLAKQGVFIAGGNSNTIDHLTAVQLRHYRLPFAPPQEQRAIVAFLDRETARIDALVAKKERLIELLQEKRTALITRAVTKGLDPNVPMKDSGVEWLGEIPGHWEAKRIKWAARMESGHTPDKKVESYWQGGDIPWISLADTGQLRKVDYVATTQVMTTSDGIAMSSAHILPAGTVVFSRDATIGLSAITCAGMAVSQHFIGWVCGSGLQPEYLLLVLRSMTQELERLTMGATVRTIGMPDVKSLAIPIPPRVEQQEIVRQALRRRNQLDALVAKVHEAIERLRELRTALISAAVTGKIDVRDALAGESHQETTVFPP